MNIRKTINSRIENVKEQITALFDVVNIIQERDVNVKINIPLICIEGLPGSGKTTQLQQILSLGANTLGKIHVVDLPTNFNIGKALSELYKDQKTFDLVSKEVPWLNVLMVSANLRLELVEAQRNGCDIVLMSRGLLSTFFYNNHYFLANGLSPDEAAELLVYLLRGFFPPLITLFINVPINVAHDRIMKRNREPFRYMDSKKGLQENRDFFKRMFLHFNDRSTILEIDGDREQNKVSYEILKLIQLHLKEYCHA